MGWTETHSRWQALQEIEALANESGSGEVPWNERYAAIFGDRAGLVAALRHRWEQTRRAQLDLELPEAVLEEQCLRITARQAGVLRVLERHDLDRDRRVRGAAVRSRVPA